MANKRDTLIKTFQARNRRKPGGIDQGFPKGGTAALKPGKTSPTVDTKLYRSDVPPPHIYAPAVVPGYGQYVHEKGARKMRQINAAYDHVVNSHKQRNYGPPLQRAPYDRRRNRGTRPNPGSATNHRPTLD